MLRSVSPKAVQHAESILHDKAQQVLRSIYPKAAQSAMQISSKPLEASAAASSSSAAMPTSSSSTALPASTSSSSPTETTNIDIPKLGQPVIPKFVSNRKKQDADNTR